MFEERSPTAVDSIGSGVLSQFMEKLTCIFCNKPKATLSCGACNVDVCKSCAQFLDEESISFWKRTPKNLEHAIYCGPCFDAQVAPALEFYNQTMARAKEVLVFFKDQGKETRLFKRSEIALKIENCPDRDETVLRLAFLAAQENFNAIIDVDLSSKKIRNAGYQTSTWCGSAIPTQVDLDKLHRKVEFLYRRNS